jgi:hypothetical protein
VTAVSLWCWRSSSVVAGRTRAGLWFAPVLLISYVIQASIGDQRPDRRRRAAASVIAAPPIAQWVRPR